jgi:hypothetical protein
MKTQSEYETIYGPMPTVLSQVDQGSFWYMNVKVYHNDEPSKDYWLAVDTVRNYGVRYVKPLKDNEAGEAITETVDGKFRFEFSPMDGIEEWEWSR